IARKNQLLKSFGVLPEESGAITAVDPKTQGLIPNPANAVPEGELPPVPLHILRQMEGDTVNNLTAPEATGAPVSSSPTVQRFMDIFGDDALAFQRQLDGDVAGIYSRRDNQSRVKTGMNARQTEQVAMHEGMHKAVNTLLNNEELDIIRVAVNQAMDADPKI